METGKSRRMRHIFRPDRKCLIIAMDHGVSVGPVKGLDEMSRTVKQLVEGHVDALLMHKGIAKRIEFDDAGLIIHVSASTNLGSKSLLKVPVCTVEEAIRIGADAVSAHINIGADDEDQMLRDLGELANECDSYGMPLLAMMYPRGPKIKSEHEPEVVAHATRIGAELGADIVKTPYTGDPETFRRVIRSVPVPVVIAGGPRMNSDSDVLEMARGALEAGAAGLSIGRNVFQHDTPTLMARALEAIVHHGATLDKSLAILEGQA